MTPPQLPGEKPFHAICNKSLLAVTVEFRFHVPSTCHPCLFSSGSQLCLSSPSLKGSLESYWQSLLLPLPRKKKTAVTVRLEGVRGPAAAAAVATALEISEPTRQAAPTPRTMFTQTLALGKGSGCIWHRAALRMDAACARPCQAWHSGDLRAPQDLLQQARRPASSNWQA